MAPKAKRPRASVFTMGGGESSPGLFNKAKLQAISRRHILVTLYEPGGVSVTNKITLGACKRTRAAFARLIRKIDNAIANAKGFKS
jgi:hypothetical protein